MEQVSLMAAHTGRYRRPFICQGTSTRRQRSDLFGFESSCHQCYYHSNHCKFSL